jgi:arsenate reductase (thioredoxin)
MSEPPPTPERPRRVLFVCVENCCRSQMAEAFARLHGGGRVEAHSAGVRPAGRVHPKTVAAMREVGYDLGPHRPKGLAELPDVTFDVAVTMGAGDLGGRVRALQREDWDIPSPKGLPPEQFQAVRDQIEGKVRALLTGLGAHRRREDG